MLAVLLLVAGGAVAFVLVQGEPRRPIRPRSAKVGLPLGGGTIESVSVVTGPHSRPVQVDLRGHQLWPQGQIPAGSKVSIEVVVKRPGWVVLADGQDAASPAHVDDAESDRCVTVT